MVILNFTFAFLFLEANTLQTLGDYWEMPLFKNANVDFILGRTFYLRELFWPDLFDVVRLVCLDISFQSMFAPVANF